MALQTGNWDYTPYNPRYNPQVPTLQHIFLGHFNRDETTKQSFPMAWLLVFDGRGWKGTECQGYVACRHLTLGQRNRLICCMFYFQMSQQIFQSLKMLIITGFKTLLHFCENLRPRHKRSLKISHNDKFCTSKIHPSNGPVPLRPKTSTLPSLSWHTDDWTNTEDYDHVKLKSPYSWYVGTRYGEATEGGNTNILS